MVASEASQLRILRMLRLIARLLAHIAGRRAELDIDVVDVESG